MKNLESRDRGGKGIDMDQDAPITKPVFTTALNNAQNVSEGTTVHLECRLEPMNDPNLRVEWFIGGKPIKMGSRLG